MPLATTPNEIARLGFPVPDWIAVGCGSDAGPVILLADSAGANMQGLLVACRLALADTGQSASLVIGDDRRDPSEATAVAQAASRHGIDCCIGHFGTRTALPASAIYGEHGVPFLAPGSSGDTLCRPDAPTTLRFFGRDHEQRACLAAAARDAVSTITILGQPGNYGTTLAETLATDLANLAPALHIAPADALRDHPDGDASDTTIICGSKEFAATCLDRPTASMPAAILLSDDSFGSDFATCPARDRMAVAFLDEMSDRLLDQSVRNLRTRANALGATPGAYFETSYLAVRAFLSVWRRFGRDRAAGRRAALADRWQTPYGVLQLSPSGDLVGHRWAMRPVG